MNRKEWTELKQRLTKGIPGERNALDQEERRLRTKKAAITPAELMEIATPWDGTSELIGRVHSIDYERWNVLIQTDEWSYVLIDTYGLRGQERTRSAATAIARLLSVRNFPGEGYTNLVKVTPAGNAEMLLHTRNFS